MASQRLLGISKKAVIFDSLCKVQKRGTASVASSLKFDDFQSVYQFKTTKELMRSYSILRLCGIDFFVDNSLKVSQKFDTFLPKFTKHLKCRPHK